MPAPGVFSFECLLHSIFMLNYSLNYLLYLLLPTSSDLQGLQVDVTRLTPCRSVLSITTVQYMHAGGDVLPTMASCWQFYCYSDWYLKCRYIEISLENRHNTKNVKIISVKLAFYYLYLVRPFKFCICYK